MMNLVMTSAPLAMVECGHLGDRRDRSASNGTCSACSCRASSPARLIVRFGVERIVAAGLVAHRRERRRSAWPAPRCGISGSALVLLGVGWNFAFVGATTMVTAVPPPERAQHRSRPSTISWSSAPWRSARSPPASCWRRSAGPRSTPGRVPGRADGRRPAALGRGVALRPGRPDGRRITCDARTRVSGHSARCVGGVFGHIRALSSVRRFAAYPRHIQPGGSLPGMPQTEPRIIP